MALHSVTDLSKEDRIIVKESLGFDKESSIAISLVKVSDFYGGKECKLGQYSIIVSNDPDKKIEFGISQMIHCCGMTIINDYKVNDEKITTVNAIKIVATFSKLVSSYNGYSSIIYIAYDISDEEVSAFNSCGWAIVDEYELENEKITILSALTPKPGE